MTGAGLFRLFRRHLEVTARQRRVKVTQISTCLDQTRHDTSRPISSYCILACRKIYYAQRVERVKDVEDCLRQ